jgi:hypothetical protein
VFLNQLSHHKFQKQIEIAEKKHVELHHAFLYGYIKRPMRPIVIGKKIIFINLFFIYQMKRFNSFKNRSILLKKYYVLKIGQS